jgi:hypothetical protein
LEYSKNGTYYGLYLYQATKRPKIILSWEHTDYEWVEKEDFIIKARSARDTYMTMAADIVQKMNLVTVIAHR